ncbi:MAG TPA: hypothetical protein VFL54_11160, partial [Gammaproteobacteria bacterium]|nr:hypothetical protein [Gammaproteobacteria bacterium]
WTRTFTSALSASTATYTITVSGAPDGLDITVSPASLTLAPGATQTVTFTANASGLQSGKWEYARIDLITSDSGDDGKPIPAMHLPVAIEPQIPPTTMTVSPANLDIDIAQNDSLSKILHIGNTGAADLYWSVVSGGQSPPITLWTRADHGTANNGAASSLYPDIGEWYYSAAQFELPSTATITGIVANGYATYLTTFNPALLNATAVSFEWYIYADNNGVPAGAPHDGLNDYLWHYSAARGAAGVAADDRFGEAGVVRNDIRLDLSAAGLPPIKLEAGNYWLIVAPLFHGSYNANAPVWWWLWSDAETPSAMTTDGSGWQSANASFPDTLAFTLTGTLGCAGGTFGGIAIGEPTGMLPGATSVDVPVTFDAAEAGAGTYSGLLCVAGNDPDQPLVRIPLSASVTAAPNEDDDNAGSGDGDGGSSGSNAPPPASPGDNSSPAPGNNANPPAAIHSTSGGGALGLLGLSILAWVCGFRQHEEMHR